MRKLLVIVMVTAILSLPVAVQASEMLPAPAQQTAAPLPGESGFDAAKAIAIGAGIVIGASVLSSVLSFRGATLLGAVAGGLIGSWWYGDRSEVALLEPRKIL
jgi:hypothetical protein